MNGAVLFTGLLCVSSVFLCDAGQYIFVEESLNWTEALTFCRQNYTDLASISSEEEMGQLTRPKTSTYAWIGLTIYSWSWSGSDSTSQYSKWASGAPLSDPNYRCVLSGTDNLWWNIPCSYGRPFMCYIASVPKTYILVEYYRSWWAAVSYCRQRYTDLALVENAEEHQNMTSLKGPSSMAWIGLYQSWCDGTFYWFTNWAPGRPLGSGPRCVAEDLSHLWTDLTCDTRLPFYCYNGTRNTTVTPTLPVRLVGGSTCSGRVEVFYNGQWGTVSYTSWYISNAQVVCRQMGCGPAVSALGGAYFGQGSGPIWINGIWCYGSEQLLMQCEHSSFGPYTSGHQYDVGVICEGNNTVTTTTAPTTTAVKLVPEQKKSSVMKMEFSSDRDLTDPTNQAAILKQIEAELQKRGHVGAKVSWKKVPQKKKKSEL